MNLLTSTLRLYRDAATDAARALPASALAFGYLLTAWLVLALTAIPLSSLGLIGGVILSLLYAAASGTYLALLQLVLPARASVRGLPALRASLGRHTWEIVGVSFWFWILDMLLQAAQAPGVVVLLIQVAVMLLLNPLPEMIGRVTRGDTSGSYAIQQAWRWMQQSGPEWLVPQVLLVGGLALAAPDRVVYALQLFGPYFQFISAGQLAVAGGAGWLGWALGLGLVLLVHAWMLFRGALFLRLSQGGRRARAWQDRLRS